jgi:hypothetical protein
MATVLGNVNEPPNSGIAVQQQKRFSWSESECHKMNLRVRGEPFQQRPAIRKTEWTLQSLEKVIWSWQTSQDLDFRLVLSHCKMRAEEYQSSVRPIKQVSVQKRARVMAQNLKCSGKGSESLY